MGRAGKAELLCKDVDTWAGLEPSTGRVAEIFDISLPRPRDRLSADFENEERRVLGALNGTLISQRSRAAALPE